MTKIFTIAAVLASLSTQAAAQDDTIWLVEPGDNLVASCTTDNCMPNFEEGDYRNPRLWECRVVSEEEYASGEFPGGTECVRIN
jgi:hypothetical protein